MAARVAAGGSGGAEVVGTAERCQPWSKGSRLGASVVVRTG
jgi:hypothetical protein